MATRLPPLNALRTFEAAARHLSFTKAADELFVTQAAVSHQICTLEEHLGTVLFRRMNRSLMLTDEGQALLPAVREAFDLLSAGVRRVQDLCSGGALSISTTPSFAASWLVGRIARFQALHPEIELQLERHGATGRFRARGHRLRHSLRHGRLARSDQPAPVPDRAGAGMQPAAARWRQSATASGRSGAPYPVARVG